MKQGICGSVLAMSLAVFGLSAQAADKDTPAKGSYQCAAFSILDGTKTPSEPNWNEGFEFKDTETSVAKKFGVTDGGEYVFNVSRETNSEGDRINMLIHNTQTKATSVAQFEEGSKSPLVMMSPDGKFQLVVFCKLK